MSILLERRSQLTGKTHSRYINTTRTQLELYYLGKAGPVQDAFPHLSADDREFIKTGITPDEWTAAFPTKPEDLFEEE